MIRISVVCLLLSLISIANLTAVELKVRVLSAQEVLNRLTETEDIKNKIEKRGKEIEITLKDLQTRGQKLAQEIQTMAKTLKPEVIAQKQEELIKLQKEIQSTQQSAREELERTQQRELMRLSEQITRAVTEMAQSKGLDIVVMKETGQVIYANPALDISGDIITLLNTQYTATKAKEAKTGKNATASSLKAA